jgi:hypothetical protein
VSDELTPEEVHEAADRVVEELLDNEGVTEPPVSAEALARQFGLVSPPRKQARPQAELTEEQRQWLAAQAIGEHLKAKVLQRLGIDPGERRGMMGESLSKLLAQRLLVPKHWLADAVRECDYDLLALKQRFRTASHEVIAWRLLDLPAACIITVVDNGEIARRRSNAWRVRRELAPAERECQRYVSQYSRPHVVNAAGWSVQGWPIHEPDRKREVLRSVVEEGAD